jgi:hypothetical protein
MHDAPQSNRLSRPTSVKAPIIGRAGSGKVQWGPHRGPIGAAGTATTSRLQKIGLPSKHASGGYGDGRKVLGISKQPAPSRCPLQRRRRSNDHCEQFDQYDSNHQHRDRHRIVIEPMPLLYRMRDTPPCSSNLTTYAHMCRTASLRGLCYFCVSSCSRSPAICAGTGVARASYWTLRQCPSDSQTLRSRAKPARFRGGRFT